MQPLVIAVGGGKGGVGKTVFSANLALALAVETQISGKRVIVIDLDFGCGNLNTCLGVPFPGPTINDYLFGRSETLEDLLVDTEQSNLGLISSTSSSFELVELNPTQRLKLASALRGLDAHYLVLDLGAGATGTVLDLFGVADHGIILSAPESISLHNAYGFIKGNIYRTLWRELGKEGFLLPLRERVLEVVEDNKLLSIGQMIENIKRWDRYAAYILQGILQDLHLHLVLNMVGSNGSIDYGKRFLELVSKYMSIEVSFLGEIPFDQRVKECVQTLKPVLSRSPMSPASTAVRDIARRILLINGHSNTH